MKHNETETSICNEHLSEALNLASELLLLADLGDRDRNDVGCGVLFGMMRDCGYKIQILTREEIAEHKRKRTWNESVLSDES